MVTLLDFRRRPTGSMKSSILIAVMWGTLDFASMQADPAGAQGKSPEDLPQRPLRFADLYREEHMLFKNEWSISRDGALAFVVKRAPGTGKTWRVKGADVWVQFKPDEQPINLTQGRSDGTDWHDPLWSPDGSHLAMVSTRGTMYSLWLWERDSRRLRQLADRPLHVGIFGAGGEAYIEWTDNQHVIASVLPPGVHPKDPGLIEPEPMVRAKAGWAKYLNGESSASLLETGRPAGAVQQQPATLPLEELRQIVRFDIADGRSTLVMNTYRPAVFHFYKPALSPDGRFIVVPVYGPPANKSWQEQDIGGTLNVVIRRTDGQPLSLDAALPGDVLPGTPVWSRDATQLAFFASGATREHAPKLVRVNVTNGRVEIRDTGDVVTTYNRDGQWDWTELEWTETGDLVFLAGHGDEALEKYGRRDWWLVPHAGVLRNLTAQLAQVPVFERLSPSGPLIGVVDGRVWRLDAAKATVQPLTSRESLQVTRIIWPQTDDYAVTSGAVGVRRYLVPREERPTTGVIVVEGKAGTERVYAKVQTSTGRLTRLTAPEPQALLARLTPQGDAAYWTDAMVNYSMVWRTDVTEEGRGAPARKVIALNEWRSTLITPPDVTIHYTSLYGDASQAWLQLPVGYRSDRLYPVIVHIYPGQKGRPEPTDPYSRMAAAAGFVVLVPQMGPDNGRLYGMVTRDVYFEVLSGVLPAVDKAIEQGIVDPQRLFVEGLSMGGFATYAVIQQTPRFRAALAEVGISSWMNGSFSARGRYGEDVAQLGIGWTGENVQQRPGVQTPWSDLGLYMRNSPIFYAERINTPLLIVHSDQDDNVPMSNSEEMFSAMVQLKKRASYVRYWGEGHAIESPANQSDLWQRRLAWFDEFGDMSRDAHGNLVFDGDHVKPRGEASALTPQDFSRFDLFQPVP
jgi:dipeptidyl aminopeptidase/acylaminoacyl peptidase